MNDPNPQGQTPASPAAHVVTPLSFDWRTANRTFKCPVKANVFDSPGILYMTSNETIPFTANFARDLITGETVTSVSAAATTPADITSSHGYSANSVTGILSGGVVGAIYTLNVQSGTTYGILSGVHEKETSVIVSNEPIGSFGKTPQEVLLIAVDFINVLTGATIKTSSPAPAVTATDTLTGATITSTVIGAATVSGSGVTFVVKAGADGQLITIECLIKDSNNYLWDAFLTLKIQEQI
jgi:hypothetical protein